MSKTEEREEKVCPYCAETIRAAAIKCRYCQSDLTVPRESRAEAAPEPEVAPQPVAVAEEPRLGWLRRVGRPWVTMTLAVLVLLLGALYVRMLMAGGDENPLPDGTTPAAQGATIEGEDAKQAGLVAATEATEEVLSYQASTLDEDIAKAEQRLGPDMRREYADTMKAIRADTLKDDAKVQATVVASSIISAGDHDVKALLFVNQSTTGKHLTEPRVDLNRVVVSLHRDEGEWTVTKLDAL